MVAAGTTRPPVLRVKICGITRLEDALLATELGADALGFVFYPKSPRYIPPERVRRIIAKLPPYVTTVGVFVNETRETVAKIAEVTGLDLIQLHGEEPPEFCAYFAPRVVKAFRVRKAEDLTTLREYRGLVRALLLDTFVPGVPGGTGKIFDWQLALKAREIGVPIILAGGLTPENISQAVAKARPTGVDVSSGVESSPGIKDPQKLKALFATLSPWRKSG